MELSDARIQGEHLGPGLTKLDDCFAALAPETIHATARIAAPGPVLLLGAPGVGKGTQADKLAELWGVPKISTGEILRANVANGTHLGIKANRIMKLGSLVPDQIMTGMVADRLGLSDTATGFILDGFPRTVHQAQWLDEYLSDCRNGAVSEDYQLVNGFRGNRRENSPSQGLPALQDHIQRPTHAAKTCGKV